MARNDKKNKPSPKEVFLENRAAHFEFRDFYTPKQTRLLLITNVICFVYGLILHFIHVFGSNSGHYSYRIFFYVSVVSLLVSLVLTNRQLIPSPRRRAALTETAMMFMVIGYFWWGVAVMVESVADGESTNFLPILVVYAFCTFFFYFSPQHYFVFFVGCCIIATWVSFGLKGGAFDPALLANIILLGAIMTFGGFFKYVVSFREYFSDKASNEFKTDLEANNEELISSNQELIELTDKLTRSNEAQKLFNASMNHELRSPLNGIVGLLQILVDDNSLNPEAHETAEKALSSSATLIQIVNDLLDFHKLEAGEFTIVTAHFDLHGLVAGVRNITQNSAAEKNLTLSFEADPNMPCMFDGDITRIQQIVTNLTSNGIKYTDTGYVKVSFAYISELLVITVEDSGQGIQEDSFESLFEPFKRLSEHRNKCIQGTGLGLAIVKQLTEQMHGEVSVSSKINKGSVFTVKLPLRVTDRNRIYSEATSEKAFEEAPEIPNLTGHKFLCVDDNRVNLTVIKGLLKATGVELTLLTSGRECIEAVQKEKYDLIFLDHMMPEMDGVETFEILKKTEHLNQDTPIIMLTANAGNEAEQAYLTQGFSAYLSKPVLKKALYEVISKFL